MKESNLQSLFKIWIKKNHDPEKNTVWELKIEKGKSFAFSRVADHQIDGLQSAKHKGLYYKIADAPFGHSGYRFHKPKPFDCLFIRGDAYVVIVFYEIRKKKRMYWIDVDKFVEERDTSTRKSLTEDRAKEIAYFESNL
jgi:hypothetical protein